MIGPCAWSGSWQLAQLCLPLADKDTSLKICWPSAAAALKSLDDLALVPPSPGNAAPPCPGDFNRDSTINVQDVFDYLHAWFIGCP